MSGAPPISPLPTMPRVSVALCTYNGARFLGEQLDSIARQSRPIDELILCDDGSSDETLAIARRFADRLPLQIQQNPARLGVTKNFEQAISRCSGDVIFLCDQDDRWTASKVARLVAALQRSESDAAAGRGAALAFSDARVVREDGSPAGYRLWDSIWFDRRERRRMMAGEALPVLLRHAVPAGCTLALRSVYRPLLLPIPDLPHVHDVWIALLLACVGPLAPVEEPLIDYRVHSGNTVGMRRYNWWGQLQMARRQLRSGAFAQSAILHQAARERLASQPEWAVSPSALSLLEEKIQHSRARDGLASSGSGRWGTIWEQWRAGNYRQFSYGLKSVLQDVFLR